MKKLTAQTASQFLIELEKKYSDYALKVKRMAPETIAGQHVYLMRLFSGMKITDEKDLKTTITDKSLRHFIQKYSRNHGSGSVGQMVFTMRSFLRYCKYSKFLDRDLSVLIPSVRRREFSHIPKALQETDIKELLEKVCVLKTPTVLRDSALIAILATYGVRGGQVRTLCLNDIDRDKKLIRFPVVKNGNAVIMPITDFVGERLALYLQKERPETLHDRVFLTMSDPPHPFNRSSSFSLIIHRKLKQCGISPQKGISHGTHGFRHAFAGRHVGSLPFEQLGNMMGHRSLRSTQLYSKISFSALQQVALPWPEDDE